MQQMQNEQPRAWAEKIAGFAVWEREREAKPVKARKGGARPLSRHSEALYHILYSALKHAQCPRISIKNGDKTTPATIKTDDNGETITLEKNEKEYYFVRIPKDQFYIKLVEDYKQK